MAAQALELAGLTKIATNWAAHPELARAICHDQDTSAEGIIAGAGWLITQAFDRNHVVKSVRKLIDKWRMYQEPGKSRRTCVFGPTLGTRLLMWFRTVTKMSDKSLEERQALWLGAFDFYTGPEGNWPEGTPAEGQALTADQALAQERLRGLLQEALPFVAKADGELTTQSLECLNSMKARSANKQTAWATSW